MSKTIAAEKMKLGKNARSFERHLALGLDAAGLDIEDFYPCHMSHTEDESKLGFGLTQVAGETDTFCCCFEDGLYFSSTENIMPINKDQPASTLAVLILVSIINENPICPPGCPQCEAEKEEN
tara:strand:+ start:178 stop:546 length:369 start_codon:yes stop_codon:yes gene_type:complete